MIVTGCSSLIKKLMEILMEIKTKMKDRYLLLYVKTNLKYSK